ncbi:MAG: TIGR00341 family protein [Promethearchaeota archaeon]|nr:MAG: TIGR00341 family protein [Candidatus Lokiarchaeota archaeon]
MRQIQISVQKEHLDKIMDVLITKLEIENVIHLLGDQNVLIIFRTSQTRVPTILEELNEIGLGTEYGIIDILPIEATIPKLSDIERVEIIEEQPLESRIALEEILEDIEGATKPNLNYFIFIILSAIIASSGLVLNSIAVVIASMIISPLMGPILGFSYGVITHNKAMLKNSLIAQTIGILLSIGCGLLLGFTTILLTNTNEITHQMSIRSFPSYLDIIITSCAGIATGFSISGVIKTSLVGVAIALSLMPPAVNIGLAFIYGDFILSLGSLILLIVNILIINICSLIVMRIKNFRALPKMKWFWQGTKKRVTKSKGR